nr:uncharacterized protein LOC109193505 [Ipomoea batatas]
MLVTRKLRKVNQKKNHHQPKTASAAPRNESNQFEALADEPKIEEANLRTLVKGKQNKELGDSSKGKSPSASSPSLDRLATALVKATTNHPANRYTSY